MTKPRKQCKKCPWKVTTDPHEIPNGYSEALHCGLDGTIAKDAGVRSSGPLRIMACHETKLGEEVPCVGWLVNQLGPGNNIPLRLAAITGRIDTNIALDGDQHETFEQTLPRPARRKRGKR